MVVPVGAAVAVAVTSVVGVGVNVGVVVNEAAKVGLTGASVAVGPAAPKIE